MKRVITACMFAYMCLALVLPVMAVAATPKLLLTGLQTGSVTSASDERIILTNITNETVDLAGYALQYFSATSSDFTKPARTIALQGSVLAGQDYNLATTPATTTTVDSLFSATLAAPGGHLRLVGADGSIDTVGWGTALYPMGQAMIAPKPGELVRRQKDEAGHFLMTGDNAIDFALLRPSSVAASNVLLSELLPNPRSPQTDAADEFIELYNPDSAPIDLEGYQILVGPSLGKRAVLHDIQLAPGEYRALSSGLTKLSLSNVGSKVQVQAPTGTVLDEVTYQKAEEGQSWARGISGVEGTQNWRWTSPTPNQENVFTPPGQDGQTGLPKATKKATKASSTAKTRKAAASPAKKSATLDKKDATKPPLHTGVVAGVGGAAVLYGSYEYKQDMYDFFRKFRRNRTNR